MAQSSASKNFSKSEIKQYPLARTRGIQRREKFDKTDTVAGLLLINMDRTQGHTYDFHDEEKRKFCIQSYSRQSAKQTVDAGERVVRESRASRTQMAKLINTSTAVSPSPKPVDQAAIRKHDFDRRQKSIKEAATNKKSTPGFSALSRQSEVHTNRNQNNLSSISTLPGNQERRDRLLGTTGERGASRRDVSQLEISLGGVVEDTPARPSLLRNKSSIEIGSRALTQGLDGYRKESRNQCSLLKGATAAQRIPFKRQEDHQRNQNRSGGAKVALNPTRFKENAVTKRLADSALSRKGSTLASGQVHHTESSFFRLT